MNNEIINPGIGDIVFVTTNFDNNGYQISCLSITPTLAKVVVPPLFGRGGCHVVCLLSGEVQLIETSQCIQFKGWLTKYMELVYG